ncbi:MAG TPA: globin domain-containing protein, partial [Thiotrichales bacterium]|nr:globin domain-containing protein [Thiotrichales bacterium]
MISSDVMKTIQATVPVLAEHGQAITTIFYQKMFAAHPELKNMFNMAHQAKGEQQRALAEAVLNYASKIDQLVELGPMVKRIAHKHASLNIQPEHYPIVGKYLLEAIQVFLNLPQDHEILRAW